MAAPGVVLPRIVMPDAVRQRAQVALQFAKGIEAHAVRVEGGRRLASQPRKGGPALLRYALAGAEGVVAVDLVPGDVRLEASSTYYLNLTEPSKGLLAAVTYHVRQGTAFALTPRFPAGYGLRSLTVNGRRDGFRFDQRSDGEIEIRLERGVPEGGRIEILEPRRARSACPSCCRPPAPPAKRASWASARTPPSTSSTPR